MEPEPTLVGRRRVFLVRMRTDQGGVDVDHVEPRIRTRRPRLRPCVGSSDLDPFQRVGVDGLEGAPHRGMRRHLTEQPRLLAQRRQVRDPFAAVGEHHRQIDQHLTAVMATTTLLGRRHRRRQRRRQPHLVGELGDQTSPDVIDDPRSVTSELGRRTPTITLHHGSALLVVGSCSRQTRVSRTRRASSRTRRPQPPATTEQGGLTQGL